MRASTALKRVRELSPEFDDDWRGTATLVRELENLAALAASTHDRLAREQRFSNSAGDTPPAVLWRRLGL